jgi:hypothetical protein
MKKTTVKWLLDRVASPISRLTLAMFRAIVTRIGCATGRNRQLLTISSRPLLEAPANRWAASATIQTIA